MHAVHTCLNQWVFDNFITDHLHNSWKDKCIDTSTSEDRKAAYFEIQKNDNNNNNNNADNVYGAIIMTQSLREFTRFIWWMQTERRVAANPQTKPTNLGCESAERLAATIHSCNWLQCLPPKFHLWLCSKVNLMHARTQCFSGFKCTSTTQMMSNLRLVLNLSCNTYRAVLNIQLVFVFSWISYLLKYFHWNTNSNNSNANDVQPWQYTAHHWQ